MTHQADDFVQLGATRDGLDPYLDCARRRGMRAVLVETPAYLRWRRMLGRASFDLELPVEQPQDPAEVATALAEAGVAPRLVLSGFERYVYAGFELARVVRAAPWPYVGERFRPLDKHQQREALRRSGTEVHQPRFALVGTDEAAELDYPQVVKPSDGGGGLGVLLVDDPHQRQCAVELIQGMRNYGGGEFVSVIAEEFVKGPELSLQGVAHDGRPYLLSVCEKLTTLEEVPGVPGLSGFREVGHLARHGSTADGGLLELAEQCLHAAGYQEGPFHVDVIQGQAGPVFVEMGFRLSGGALVALVERATGARWAEAVFAVHLDRRPPAVPPARERAVGQITAVSQEELTAGAELARAGHDVEVVRAAPFPPGDALDAADRQVLASDLSRHTGSVGRVLVTAANCSEAQALLRPLVATRLRG
ncbi:ATP-grasp domain-containing protein [Streptomyces sp. RPT161]|uniref:ATP-grasp domain-containing protein n=1 Tax=Streptomyces sp. RPT161 TaxID=3015993 RepID=UPI0022B8CD66|nr:ATP-grasp domain-containing protein [Streptomyces sp. RPT161]